MYCKRCQRTKKWAVPFLLGGVVGFFTNCKRKNKALAKAVQSLLRDRLIEKYRLFKIKGEMTILDKENIDSLFEEYKELGGNGTIKELMEDLEHTKIKIINIKE